MFARRLIALALVAAAAGGWAHTHGGSKPVGATRYVVRHGDTLWRIARTIAPKQDPRVTVDAVMRRNRLPSPTLRPGQTLYLPR